MTFKQHIEISKILSTENGMKYHLEDLDIVERLRFLRMIKETYPLESNDTITDELKSKFKCYDNVFDLVLGQFIMLEQILTGKFKFVDSTAQDLEIMTYILRPIDEEQFDNTDASKEAEHREAILNTPVQDLYNVVNKFLANRELVLFKQFSGVFYATPDEEDEDPDQFSTPTPDELYNQQWYWYSIVRMLAQEDIRRYDEVYMLKMNVVLPEMSYLAQKNKIDAANARQQAALNRL